MMGVLERARDLVRSGADVWTTPAVRPFLQEDLDRGQFMADPEVLAAFCAMDDNDVMCCIKAWQDHPDFVLSDLSRRITQRRLFKIELRDEPFNQDDIAERISTVQDAFGLSAEEAATS